MKRQLLITLSALFWAQISLAGDVGTTTAQFLKLGAGAKAISLAEAYTAIAKDATAIYYNPAGLASISGQELTGMYAIYRRYKASVYRLCQGDREPNPKGWFRAWIDIASVRQD